MCIIVAYMHTNVAVWRAHGRRGNSQDFLDGLSCPTQLSDNLFIRLLGQVLKMASMKFEKADTRRIQCETMCGH